MTWKTAVVTPASAVAQNGTFTASYPAGTTAGSFASYGHKIWSQGLQAQFAQDDGKISVSFGASSITVTYKGSTSLPANKAIRCQFQIAGDKNDVVALGSVARTVYADVLRMDLGAPAAAASTGVCTSQSVSSGVAATLNGALVSGGVATFDVPRNIVAAWTTTAVLTIRGTDEYGVSITETSASGTSHTGKKAFKTITSITPSASITGFTAGTGVVLGLPVFVEKVGQIIAELQSGVRLPKLDDKIYIQANVPLTDGTYAVSTIPMAGNITKIQAIVQGVFTTNNAVLTFKNNTTNITNGVITALVAAVAVGDQYSATPTAANAFAAGDKLMVAVSGTPGGSKTAQIIVELSPTYTPNGTFVAGDQTVPAGTTGDVRGTYSPVATMDGSIFFSLLVQVPDPTYLGATQYYA